MKTTVITKQGEAESLVCIEGDADETAFVLDMLGMVREGFYFDEGDAEPENILQ